MSDVALFIAATFAAGLFATLLRLPALLGFLLAGFLLHAVRVRELPYLDLFAEMGVTLLLFGIGLKLDVRSLLSRDVHVVIDRRRATTSTRSRSVSVVLVGCSWACVVLHGKMGRAAGRRRLDASWLRW